MCELSWKIHQPWITFSTYLNVKPLNQSILSCQDYSIRKNEASKNHFNSHHLTYIWFLKIIFLGQVSNDYYFGLLIDLPLSHTHSVTINLQPQLESSLSHFFYLHMTSPKLYPVLSALSLVVFEYDVQAHPCRLRSLCCVLGQDTLLPKCLTPPWCLNGYQQMLRSTLLWISMPFCSGE